MKIKDLKIETHLELIDIPSSLTYTFWNSYTNYEIKQGNFTISVEKLEDLPEPYGEAEIESIKVAVKWRPGHSQNWPKQHNTIKILLKNK